MTETTEGSHGRIERIETLQVSLFGTNCYVVKLASGEVAVLDPGGEPERIVAAVGELGGRLEYILCTHAHLDHVEAAGAVRAALGGRTVLHEGDLPLWENLDVQASIFGLPPPPPLAAPDIVLTGESGELRMGPVTIGFRHVPGHSPGSVAFLFSEGGAGFNGDTVFSMGVGRVDLWGGDGARLKRSIREGLLTLAEDLMLYPGHGPPITVADAREVLPMLDGFL